MVSEETVGSGPGGKIQTVGNLSYAHLRAIFRYFIMPT